MSDTMTPCQQAAQKALIQFLVDPVMGQEMLISAAAGCGKTWLINETLSDLKKLNTLIELIGMGSKFDQVYLTATTNKAAQLLGGSTVHSFLALTVRRDHRTGESYLAPTHSTPNEGSFRKSIIIVDESSMMTEEIRGMLLKACSKSSKIIYLADEWQLPPVGQAVANIFNDAIHTSRMTTPVRQKEGSSLYAACKAVRSSLTDHLRLNVQSGPDVVFLTRDGLEAATRDVIDSDGTILAFTNEKVVQGNLLVRELYAMPTDFAVGDRVLVNNDVKCRRSEVSVPKNIVGEITLIEPLNAGHKALNVLLGSTTYRLHLDGTPETTKIVLAQHKADKDWRKFYHLKELFSDVRDAYALTVHKSQGSTYPKVIVNVTDISKAKHTDSYEAYLRLLYVAISRAKDKVYIYGDIK